MEIRLIALILLCSAFLALNANAEQITPPIQNSSGEQTEDSLKNALINPQNIDFSKCCASFEMNTEKLFYLAISAVNANNFEIEEIQSKMGYILFRAVNIFMA